jgi:hypothetical protein
VKSNSHEIPSDNSEVQKNSLMIILKVKIGSCETKPRISWTSSATPPSGEQQPSSWAKEFDRCCWTLD